MHVVVQIGEPIEVASRRQRDSDTDPVVTAIGEQLRDMFSALSAEFGLYRDSADPVSTG